MTILKQILSFMWCTGYFAVRLNDYSTFSFGTSETSFILGSYQLGINRSFILIFPKALLMGRGIMLSYRHNIPFQINSVLCMEIFWTFSSSYLILFQSLFQGFYLGVYCDILYTMTWNFRVQSKVTTDVNFYCCQAICRCSVLCRSTVSLLLHINFIES